MSDNPKIRRRLRCPNCGSLDATDTYYVYLLVPVLLPPDTSNPNNALVIKFSQKHLVARGVQDDSPGHS